MTSAPTPQPVHPRPDAPAGVPPVAATDASGVAATGVVPATNGTAGTAAPADTNGSALPPALSRERVWGLVSAVAVVVGSIGPWATWGPVTVWGLDADGVITLVLGLLAVAGVVTRRFPIALVVVAAVTTLIGIADTVDVSSGNAFFDPSPGWGVILTALGGTSLTAFAGRTVLLRRATRRV
ncbi:hypothetical protein AB0L40_27690 [Patulibacter sp. NPDC049589]|uniref:hypothetical protein n=1 Tax=Patulibacter sp. NPDC049589 TaxID=3154731 RepID=UPI00341F4048